MGAFADIELEWGDRIYTIKSHRVMGAIARIEDIITLPELRACGLRGGAPIGKLAMAYAAVLRYAGATVDDDEVYEKAFANSADGGVMVAIMNIMDLMLPKSARAKLQAGAAGGEEPTGDDDAGNLPAAARASSRKPSKPRSRKANG